MSAFDDECYCHRCTSEKELWVLTCNIRLIEAHCEKVEFVFNNSKKIYERAVADLVAAKEGDDMEELLDQVEHSKEILEKMTKNRAAAKERHSQLLAEYSSKFSVQVLPRPKEA